MFFSEDAIKEISKKIIDYAKKHNKNSQHELETAENSLKQVNKKIEKLVDAVIEGMLDKDIVKSKMDKLKQEKITIESRLYEQSSRDICR